jgi:hypothetical protein
MEARIVTHDNSWRETRGILLLDTHGNLLQRHMAVYECLIHHDWA